MKIAILLLVLLAGCAVTPLPLEQFRGWSFREVGKDRFQINVGDVKKDRWHEALIYASSLTLQRGYRAFAVLEEDGKGESGTFFFWAQDYEGRAGMKSFSPGRYFTIMCRHERRTEYQNWFDAEKTQKRKTPNQTPKPTAPSGRGSS